MDSAEDDDDDSKKRRRDVDKDDGGETNDNGVGAVVFIPPIYTSEIEARPITKLWRWIIGMVSGTRIYKSSVAMRT